MNICSKVQLLLLKQDMIKTPQKFLNKPNRHYKHFPKRKNAPKASIVIAVWLSKKISVDHSQMLLGNSLQSKDG